MKKKLLKMDATDFLTFAESLIAEDNFEEISTRSAVSRAYYCVYHNAKKFLMDYLNIDVDKAEGGAHARIALLMIGDKNPRVKGLGYKIKQLHGRRVHADYHLNLDIEATAAHEAIIECKKILKTIESLS